MLQILTFLQATIAGLKARLDERGATAVEYGILVTFIALAIVVGATALGTGINGMFTKAAGKL